MADYIPFADPDLSLASSAGSLPAGSLNSGNWGTSSVSGFYPAYAGGTDTTGTASGADLTKALQGLSKGFADGQKQNNDKAPQGAAIPQLAPAGQPMRRVAIDQLAQLLNKRRDDLLAAAMKPGGQVEPYSVPHSLGLLGF
jgi:hypothetical protein